MLKDLPIYKENGFKRIKSRGFIQSFIIKTLYSNLDLIIAFCFVFIFLPLKNMKYIFIISQSNFIVIPIFIALCQFHFKYKKLEEKY